MYVIGDFVSCPGGLSPLRVNLSRVVPIIGIAPESASIESTLISTQSTDLVKENDHLCSIFCFIQTSVAVFNETRLGGAW
tara:strand:- start:266 stop:505 length:240 start_codon:yes stop_codon:yes gene_type:complete